MKRILFVEDNELLLELYGQFLAHDPGQWHVTLAPNGEAAVELLRQQTFDVVASDMRMPGMSGIELLTLVGKTHPQTARIIISGLADQAEAADSLKSTHLFLPKPCGANYLRATLARIASLDAYLKDEKLRALASRLRTVPSFPSLYSQILRAIESPSSSIEAISKIVAQDPGITAKILQVANSAACALPQKVSDPGEAVQHLGMTTIRSLVLSAQVMSNFAPGRLLGFSADALWAHLMKCAGIARAIMQSEHADLADVEDAFAAGMLHDMGKLMLASALPGEFAHALGLAAEKKIPLHEAEQQIFGATHAGLIAYLLGLWGLPVGIVEAVAFHHHPEKSNLKQFTALTAVHVADYFAHSLNEDYDTAPLNEAYLTEIHLAHRLPAWRDVVANLELETVDE